MRKIGILVLVNILFSCKEPTSRLEETPQQKIISGEIAMAVKEDIVLPIVTFKPDIEALRVFGDTAPIRLVAVGGALPAGYRNGGLYREGQLTSVPQLVAHQMQLTSFISPVFDKEIGNGSSYFIYDRDASLPTWKQVTNNLGIVAENPLSFSSYGGSHIDNVSWPEGPGSSSDSSNAFYFYPAQKSYYSYLYRFYHKRGEWDKPFEYFVDSTSQKTSLILNFDDLDRYVGMASFSRNLLTNLNAMLHEGYFRSKSDFIKENLESGRKIILYNQPDYLDFPFFHLYSVKSLKARNNTNGIALQDGDLLVPNNNVKTAFYSSSSNIITLEDQDVLSVEEIYGLRHTMNIVLNKNTTLLLSDVFNVPVVDMYLLYKNIISRKYYTDDGLFIDPSFPDGNFFSNDGVYPSAIGSAVIANETIKEINRFYGTKIPLINIIEFSKKL